MSRGPQAGRWSDYRTNSGAWDRVARWLERHDDGPQPPKSRMNWTQFPGEGPGDELLGALGGRSVVELGCGGGDTLAYLVARGAEVGTGIDASREQVRRAASRWSDVLAGRIRFLRGNASAVLGRLPTASVDVAYSVFGAISHADPAQILRELRRVLRSHGKVVFAVRHPIWPYPTEQPIASSSSGRRHVMTSLTDGEPIQIVRYCYPVPGWLDLCRSAGYAVDTYQEVFARPHAMEMWYRDEQLHSMIHAATIYPCTLIVTATMAGGYSVLS